MLKKEYRESYFVQISHSRSSYLLTLQFPPVDTTIPAY